MLVLKTEAPFKSTNWIQWQPLTS